MKRILLAAAVVALASPALANNCPNDIRAIDAALLTTSVDAAKKAEVTKLRNDADAKHKAGNHDASQTDIKAAKAILNIQ